MYWVFLFWHFLAINLFRTNLSFDFIFHVVEKSEEFFWLSTWFWELIHRRGARILRYVWRIARRYFILVGYDKILLELHHSRLYYFIKTLWTQFYSQFTVFGFKDRNIRLIMIKEINNLTKSISEMFLINWTLIL